MALWIIFDEADHYQPAPGFCLSASASVSARARVCLSDFRGRANLVVAFLHENGCTHCQAFLKGFSRLSDRYQAENAQAAVITPSASGFSPSDPVYTVLSDPESKVRRQYAALMDESLAAPHDALLFVLDIYGAPYAAAVGAEFSEESLHDEILSWLSFIGIQCPE